MSHPSVLEEEGKKAMLPLHKPIIFFLYSISDLDAKIVITIVQWVSVSQRLPGKQHKWIFGPMYAYFLEKKKSITLSITVNKHLKQIFLRRAKKEKRTKKRKT